jgi:hypothetical protein
MERRNLTNSAMTVSMALLLVPLSVWPVSSPRTAARRLVAR